MVSAAGLSLALGGMNYIPSCPTDPVPRFSALQGAMAALSVHG